MTTASAQRIGGKSSSLVASLSTFLVCVFAAEMILGGPGYWGIGSFSFRKLLFTANFAWFLVLWAVGVIRMQQRELLIALSISALLAVWMLLVPVANNPQQLPLAIQDGLPLAMGILGVLLAAYFRPRADAWKAVEKTVAVTLCVSAFLNILLWLVGMTGESGNFAAQAAALVWFTLGRIDLDPPLYVGLMPDGFFRAMWITGTLYMPALMICLARRKWLGVALFSLALIATYTRSLWLATLIGVAVAQLISHPKARYLTGKMVAAAAILGAIALGSILSFAGNSATSDFLSTLTTRISTVLSDSSAEERFEQVGPLIDEWETSPLVGHGFGANASIIRSTEAPFSYELTVLALMMKLGLIGLALLALLGGSIWATLLARPNFRRDLVACASLGSIFAFTLAAATNPFLLNFVGMSFLSYAFIIARTEAKACSSRGHHAHEK